jgi:hypothetical protein
VHEIHCPATSKAEYHMAKKNRSAMKDQVVYFTNGCPKEPIHGVSSSALIFTYRFCLVSREDL